MEIARGYKFVAGFGVINVMRGEGGIHRGRVDAGVGRACALEANVKY